MQRNKDGCIWEHQQRPYSCPPSEDSWSTRTPETRATAGACLHSRPMWMGAIHKDGRAIRDLTDSDRSIRVYAKQSKLVGWRDRRTAGTCGYSAMLPVRLGSTGAHSFNDTHLRGRMPRIFTPSTLAAVASSQLCDGQAQSLPRHPPVTFASGGDPPELRLARRAVTRISVPDLQWSWG